MPNARLQLGIDVRQKQKFRIEIARRNLRRKGLEDIQLRRQRVRLVQRAVIGAGPVEALPAHVLDARCIHAALASVHLRWPL